MLTAPLNPATPLLFIDIDGVLGHEFNDDARSNMLCRDCIARLNRIVRETGAKIVVSSSWRYMISLGAISCQGFAYLLRTHGGSVDLEIVGITPLDEEVEGRGRQIAAWFEFSYRVDPAFPSAPTRYLVIDDDEHGITAAGHPFVQTDGSIGLTEADADRAIALLAAPPQPDIDRLARESFARNEEAYRYLGDKHRKDDR